jgi:hypothetical protein
MHINLYCSISFKWSYTSFWLSLSGHKHHVGCFCSSGHLPDPLKRYNSKRTQTLKLSSQFCYNSMQQRQYYQVPFIMNLGNMSVFTHFFIQFNVFCMLAIVLGELFTVKMEAFVSPYYKQGGMKKQ